MVRVEQYGDPRLVEVYDSLDPDPQGTDFYVDLASSASGSAIAEVHCGTGRLAVVLAHDGHRVTAAEPSAALLDVARRRPGGDRVRWLHGGPEVLGADDTDLVAMTRHVVQELHDDSRWRATLVAAHHALAPGGRLAFASRNPAARAWRSWTPDTSRRQVDDPTFGPIDVWHRLTSVRDDRVTFETHHRFALSGEEVVSRSELRFRSRSVLQRSLEDAGFVVEDVFGDWDRSPVTPTSPELIFVARRP